MDLTKFGEARENLTALDKFFEEFGPEDFRNCY